MESRFETLTEKKFVGNRVMMSSADNKTFDLWRNFMPQRKAIQNVVGTELYSIEVYPKGFFERFDPNAEFEKWAAVEVADFETVADGLEIIVVPGGDYAVFSYKGLSGEGAKAYRYIFAEWLPKSGYSLDSRPHFAKMGEKYKNDDPNSEEELWIPVKIEKRDS